jgi:hypothetical protein
MSAAAHADTAQRQTIVIGFIRVPFVNFGRLSVTAAEPFAAPECETVRVRLSSKKCSDRKKPMGSLILCTLVWCAEFELRVRSSIQRIPNCQNQKSPWNHVVAITALIAKFTARWEPSATTLGSSDE